MQDRYSGKVARVLHSPMRYIVLYALLITGLALMFIRLPSGFLPTEDQGNVMVQFTLPAGRPRRAPPRWAKRLSAIS